MQCWHRRSVKNKTGVRAKVVERAKCCGPMTSRKGKGGTCPNMPAYV